VERALQEDGSGPMADKQLETVQWLIEAGANVMTKDKVIEQLYLERLSLVVVPAIYLLYCSLYRNSGTAAASTSY
jgi:hypothetical protein